MENAVVLHIDQDGNCDLKVLGCAGVRVFWVDERAPGDRVYEYGYREPDASEIMELLGTDPVGHAGDAKNTPEFVQAVLAKLWQMDGNRLRPV